MAEQQGSPERMRDLANQIVKAILEDEDLAAMLGQGLGQLEAKKCPKNYKCTRVYKCPKPFSCSKGYTLTPKAQIE